MPIKTVQEIISALPETPGILGRERYREFSVLIPLIHRDGEYHLLFEKRAQGIRQAGEICFPGGEIEPDVDNNFQDAAVRETIEEIGVKRQQIRIIGQTDSLFTGRRFIIHAYVGELIISSIDSLNLNRDEVEEVFTLPISYFTEKKPHIYQVIQKTHPSFQDESGNEIILLPAADLGLPEQYHKPWGVYRDEVFVYPTGHGPLWGITARFVRDLVNKISKNP